MPGVSTLQVMTRALRNTPVPMTLPTTSEKAASRPRPRTRATGEAGDADEVTEPQCILRRTSHERREGMRHGKRTAWAGVATAMAAWVAVGIGVQAQPAAGPQCGGRSSNPRTPCPNDVSAMVAALP